MLEQMRDGLKGAAFESKRIDQAVQLQFGESIHRMVSNRGQDVEDLENEPEGLSVFGHQGESAALHARDPDFLFERSKRYGGTALHGHHRQEDCREFLVYFEPFPPVLLVVARGFPFERFNVKERVEDLPPFFCGVLPLKIAQGNVEVGQPVDRLRAEFFRSLVFEELLELGIGEGKTVQIVVQVRYVDVHLPAVHPGTVPPLRLEGVGKKQETPEFLVRLEPDTAHLARIGDR